MYVLSTYSNVKVSLNSAQNVSINKALTLVKKVSLRNQRNISHNEYTILDNRLLILTGVLNLTEKAKLTVDKFRTSINVNTTEATNNAMKIYNIVVKYRMLLLQVGKYSFNHKWKNKHYKLISLSWYNHFLFVWLSRAFLTNYILRNKKNIIY